MDETPLEQLPPPPTPPATAPIPDADPPTDGFAIAALIFSIIGGVVIALVLALISFSRISKGKRKGKGLAIAAVCISLAWAVVITLAIIGATSSNDSDAGNFSGEKKAVAKVIDDFEATASDQDEEALCALFTPKFRDLLGRGAVVLKQGNTCESYYRITLEGKRQQNIEIKSIRLDGSNKATVKVTEGTDPLTMKLVKTPIGWKIDDIL